MFMQLQQFALQIEFLETSGVLQYKYGMIFWRFLKNVW